MGQCKNCHSWLHETDKCRLQKYEVLTDDAGDNWDDAWIIGAMDFEEAAEKWADENDCHHDYTIIQGSEITVRVRKQGSADETLVTLTGESVAKYSGYIKEPTP